MRCRRRAAAPPREDQYHQKATNGSRSPADRAIRVAYQHWQATICLLYLNRLKLFGSKEPVRLKA